MKPLLLYFFVGAIAFRSLVFLILGFALPHPVCLPALPYVFFLLMMINFMVGVTSVIALARRSEHKPELAYFLCFFAMLILAVADCFVCIGANFVLYTICSTSAAYIVMCVNVFFDFALFFAAVKYAHKLHEEELIIVIPQVDQSHL